jgi:hypothetical protein
MIDPSFAADQQSRLQAALGTQGTPAAAKTGGAMTTGDIMALVAEVLTSAAENANEMRFQEGKASLGSVQASLKESQQAAAQKVQGAVQEREASTSMATGQMISAACSMAGALVGGAIGVARPNAQAAAQAASQFGSGLGNLIDGHYKLEAANSQFSARVFQANAELTQAYSQQSSTLGQRTQGSASDQGQAVQSLIRAFNEFISITNQSIMAQVNALKS